MSGQPLEETQLSALERQQFFLDREAAAKSGQMAIAPADAVARNDDGYGVRTIREAHCARRIRASDSSRQLSVADRLSVGNLLQVAPDKKLKLRAVKDQRQIEVL